MRKKEQKIYCCDFETSVYEGQTSTEVWSSALVELYKEDVIVHGSIDATFAWIKEQKCNLLLYYHNLKFDGSFWLDFLIKKLGLKQAFQPLNAEGTKYRKIKDRAMYNNSFKYVISDRGQWYSITIKLGGKIIELRDSLKLLPFSLRELGQAFQTTHQKLDMEYKGYRYANCPITDKELDYIKNDVLVLKECLEYMYNHGHDRMTIGSCCMAEYKAICKTSTKNMLEYDEMFPNLGNYKIDKETYGTETASEYIRKSYRGGWCYLAKGKEKKVYKNGLTADVNSLYPSVMHSESGCRYPIGLPTFWSGSKIPKEALLEDRYYFIRIRTKFKLKRGKLPTIQIKNSYFYNPREYLETSDIFIKPDKKSNKKSNNKYLDKIRENLVASDSNSKNIGKRVSSYIDPYGNKHDTSVELTLTMTDYELIKKHYHLIDCEILDGCYFYAQIGIFDEYIDKYAKMKMEAKTPVERCLAKLFLNNLYGKYATSSDSSFKLAYIKEDGNLGFQPIEEHEKEEGYIPVGSAITSYARNFTITTAQANYHGKKKRGFIYADTDSIHCDLSISELVKLPIHETKFCHWKIESKWDEAIFVRQKTYIEHQTENKIKETEYGFVGKECDEYLITCAGMPPRCKDLFEMSLRGTEPNKEELSPEEQEFLYKDNEFIHRTLTNFDVGLKIPGKLLPKRMDGGIVLMESTYEMR